MGTLSTTQAVTVELDPQSWSELVERAASWLTNVGMAQTAYRQLAEDTIDKIREPHVREYLADIIAKAKRHEEQIPSLYRMLGKEPSGLPAAGGSIVAKTRQLFTDLQGFAGGAAGAWAGLHHILLANLNAIGAFGVAQQLGLALGNRELTEVTLKITNEKYNDHYLLQEIVMAMAPLAILYKSEI